MNITKHFESRRINIRICDDIISAQVTLVELVSKFREEGFRNIGLGNIVSLHRINITDILQDFSNLEIVNSKGFDSRIVQANYYNWIETIQQNLAVDVYITSVDAITLKGEIFSSDYIGDQIGGVIFGPRRVIIIAGKNHIVENLDIAIKRKRGLSSTIIYGAMEGFKDRIHVILVNEDLEQLNNTSSYEDAIRNSK